MYLTPVVDNHCLLLLIMLLQLLQELDQHKSFVNTLCFNQDGSLLYSGDSCGNVCVWNVVLEDGASLSGMTLFTVEFTWPVVWIVSVN